MTDPGSAYERRAFLAGLAVTLAACGRGGTDVAAERGTTMTSTSTSTTGSTTSSSSTTSTTSTTTPTTTMPAAVETGPAGSVCRAAWGARAARDGGRAHTITRLTVHHSAEVLGDGEDPTAHLRRYQTSHMDASGWVDIAYHVAVDRAGTAYELRSTAIAGDTNTGYDPAGHFLVLAIGNFEEQTPTEAQLDGVARVLRWGTDTFGAPLSTVTGHRDHAATACPGAALYPQLDELRRRAEALPAAGLTAC